MRATALVVLVLALAGCGSGKGISVSVMPKDSALTHPVEIRVSGLRAHQLVTLSINAKDANGRRFAASGRYRADAHGVVDLARAAPVGNQPYVGAWQMGLPTSISAGGAAFFWNGNTAYQFDVTVRREGETVARGTFLRRLSERHVVLRTLTYPKDHLVGTYAYAQGSEAAPAALAFGGSEGGSGSALGAAVLAAEGIPTLSLGYFDAPGLPAELKDIPLEYFHRALLWLDRQRQVDPRRVSVLGVSRGSEPALLLPVFYPALVHGVVALVPTSVVHCGIAGGGRGDSCVGAAWTLNGKPIPYTRQIGAVDPNDPTDAPAAIIPVARIRVPILLACGGGDDVWPSCPYSRAIARRHGSRNLSLFAYADAAHFVGALIPYEPWELALDETTERAREQLWPHVVAFLRRN